MRNLVLAIHMEACYSYQVGLFQKEFDRPYPFTRVQTVFEPGFIQYCWWSFTAGSLEASP